MKEFEGRIMINSCLGTLNRHNTLVLEKCIESYYNNATKNSLQSIFKKKSDLSLGKEEIDQKVKDTISKLSEMDKNVLYFAKATELNTGKTWASADEISWTLSHILQ
jgi:DNA-directed RNA polymerase specialized sigma subunit